MTQSEYEAGKQALLESTHNDTFLKALAFIYRNIPTVEVDKFSENPYRNAFYSGQRSAAQQIADLVGVDVAYRLRTLRLN